MPIIHLLGYVFIFRQGAAARKLNVLTVPRTMALFSFYLKFGLAFEKIFFTKESALNKIMIIVARKAFRFKGIAQLQIHL